MIYHLSTYTNPHLHVHKHPTKHTYRYAKAPYDNEKFLADVQLVWDNCRTYNAPKTPLHALADDLEKEFDFQYGLWVRDEETRPANPDIQ